MKRTVLVSDDQVRDEITFVDQQRDWFRVRRQVEDYVGCVGLAGTKRVP